MVVHSDERTALDRTAVTIRVLVVLAVGLVLALGPRPARGAAGLLAVLVVLALVYALAMVVGQRVGRSLLPAPVASAVDAVLIVVVCGLSGGAQSVLVALLPLAVIAAAVRGGVGPGRVAALLTGLGFTVGAVLGSDPGVALVDRLLVGVWWTGLLVAVAVLVGTLVGMLARQLDAAAATRALLAAQQARLDGARVVVHEFRTPVASLTALSADLAADRLPPASRPRAVRLLAEHAEHLRDMLDGLADVALAEGNPLGRVGERRIALAELAEVVLDAAAVPPTRRAPTVAPPDAAVRCDPQRLRRVLTNLVENAARHSGDAPVELDLRLVDGRLVAEVRDRGPGLPPGQEGRVTAKGVALGERRGTAGLGLWIVEALVGAMGGELTLAPRPGGGLVARLELPVPPGGTDGRPARPPT